LRKKQQSSEEGEKGRLDDKEDGALEDEEIGV
jgi:hypothetical protein